MRRRRSSRATASVNTRRSLPPARLRFSDAVPLVRFRAQAMQEAVPAGVGAMAAILGLDAASVAAACAEAAQGQVVEPVNFNTPEQIVIAGHREAVERAIAAATAKGAKRGVLLPVSAPFHSSLMKPAAERLAARLASVPFVDARDCRWCRTSTSQAQSDPDAIRAALALQAASPVRWVETIQAFAARGVTQVVECGPGRVLTGHEQAHRSQVSRATRSTPAPTSTATLDRDRRRQRTTGGCTMADAALAEQVALVTGATRGIGEAIARALAQPARRSCGTATTDEGAAKIASYLERSRKPRHGDSPRCRRRRCGRRRRSPTSRARFGAITILVNNAGITRDNLLLRMKDDEWDAIMATNLKPAFRLAKAVLRGMMKARSRSHHPDRLGRRDERQPGPGQLRGGEGRRCSASPSRSPRKWGAATSPSTAWRRASSTPT